MLKTLLRGGQTSLHSWRMTVQLIKVIIYISLFVILLSSCWQGFRYWQERPQEFKAALWHVLASAQFWQDDQFVHEINMPDGQIRRIQAGQLRHAPAFINSWTGLKIHMLDNITKSVFIALIGMGFLLIFFWLRGRTYSRIKRVRGAELVTAKKLSMLSKKTYNSTDKEKPWQLAGVSWPKNGETLHTLITGSTGSGKTVAMLELLDQIEERGGKAIIYDKMGSFVPHFYRPDRDIILNPFDVRSSDWDIFAEARTETDFETMAAALIPHFKDANDPFWTSAARQLFASGAASMWKTGEHSMHNLVDLLMKMDLKELAKRMDGTVAQSIVDPAAGKTALSVRTVLTTHLRPISFLSAPKTPFSIRNWVEQSQSGFLFLTSDAATHEARRAMIATQIELALVALLTLPRSHERRLWFIIDELPTLHQIPSLASGLRESRQFGGAMVLGTQVFSELRDIYGREAATTIAGNCNTRLVLNTPDMDTAEWLSDSLGRIEVERIEENISYGAAEIRDGVGLSRREQLRRLVIPSDIMRLQPLQGFIKMPHALPVARIKLHPRDRKTVEDSSVDIYGKNAKISEDDLHVQNQNQSPLTDGAEDNASSNLDSEEWNTLPPSGPPTSVYNTKNHDMGNHERNEPSIWPKKARLDSKYKRKKTPSSANDSHLPNGQEHGFNNAVHTEIANQVRLTMKKNENVDNERVDIIEKRQEQKIKNTQMGHNTKYKKPLLQSQSDDVTQPQAYGKENLLKLFD